MQDKRPIQVPIIDIGPYINSYGQTKQIAANLRQVCKNIGFFYVKNHGVPKDLQFKIFKNMEDFFNLPKQEKNKIHMKNNLKGGTGYFNLLEQFTGGTVDIKQGIYFSQQLQPNHPKVVQNYPFHGNFCYPQHPQDLKKNVLEWMKYMQNVGDAIMQGISQSLGFDRKYLKQEFYKEYLGLLTMFHYPRDSLLAGGEHTDYGFMTILMSSSKGLQVKSREGEWLNIDPIEDHFIINICDTLERMTKGLYKSSIHRVRNNQGVSRYSIPFFYDPGWQTILRQLDFQISPQEQIIIKQNLKEERPDKQQLTQAMNGKYGNYFMKKLGKAFPNSSKFKQFQ